jgi:hypothetical protein
MLDTKTTKRSTKTAQNQDTDSCQCPHQWRPKYDYCSTHIQRYRCSLCGVWGARFFDENPRMKHRAKAKAKVKGIVSYNIKSPREGWNQNQYWEEWAANIVRRQNLGEDL